MASDSEAAKQQRLWGGVIEMTKAAQETNTDPLLWAMRLSSSLSAAGVSMPSVEVAELLVSHICWSNNTPISWKFLEKALTVHIVPPLFVLAVLTVRVMPSRRRYPTAYRLYMELLRIYAFSLPSQISSPNYHKVMESINNVLNLREIFGVHFSEPGHIVVIFIFSIVCELLDASLDDDGLLDIAFKNKPRWPIKSQDMEIDCIDEFEGKKLECQATLSKMNMVMATEIIAEFFRNKVTCQMLFLARRNMPTHWDCFIRHLRLLITSSTSLRKSKVTSPEALQKLTSDTRLLLPRACKMILVAPTPMPAGAKCNGTARSSIWLPIDLYLEDMIDGSEVSVTSAAETLTGLVKSLQAVHRTTWQDAFLGLWTAALRLVQREWSGGETPVPRIYTCLSLLLSIATLAVSNIVEEEIMLSGDAEQNWFDKRKRTESVGKCCEDLVSSLQQLDEFETLLTPPPLISSLANHAAVKAMLFLSGVSAVSGIVNGMSLNNMPPNVYGNLRHLIVEACIARNVLDTSAYMWPRYVKGRYNQIPRNISGQVPGWSSLMEGSPLTPPMISALVSTPANSLAEIERIYEIAVSGSDDEKIFAATILCGASLFRGWNIQEHIVHMITKLLSPAVPTNISGTESHLIGYAPFFNILLVGISPADYVQIFSLHGLVPQLAAALMPICEVFGSCARNMSWTINTKEELSSYAVFSNALILLLKLWRFGCPPLDNVMGDITPVGSHLTPDFLLLVHNSQLASHENLQKNQNESNRRSRLSYRSSRGPVFMDSFPKLKHWYGKQQECISAILSSLVPGNTIHQIVEALLSMMFRKINREGQMIGAAVASGSSSSSSSGPDESVLHLNFTAWDILESVPFVLDASLTACAYGTLSSRELITGLKDLADFLPASLGTMISYFSAELSRGLWKHASMNGTDWPSPAANLSMIEEQIKNFLSATGVDVPCLAIGASSHMTLPLPLAVLTSLTITYKLDRLSDLRSMNLVGPALRHLGMFCPWPSMAIISALWAQKVKRWSEYIIFAASQTVFHHNDDAVMQLLRACFSSALGLPASSPGGVGPLLGYGFGPHSPIAPGTLYLRVHRALRSVMLMTEQIVHLLIQTVNDIAGSGLPEEKTRNLRKIRHGSRYGQVSLAGAMERVKTAASLAASLVWMKGRPSLVQAIFKEVLPSWFISLSSSEHGPTAAPGGTTATLTGYALAYFALMSGMFAWGMSPAAATPATRRRRRVVEKHLEFVASALNGRISLGCDRRAWRAYVTGYLSLMISCTPGWVAEVDVEVLKSVSQGLRLCGEEEMAVALLASSGMRAMGAAAEVIVEIGG